MPLQRQPPAVIIVVLPPNERHMQVLLACRQGSRIIRYKTLDAHNTRRAWNPGHTINIMQ